jgi:predicted glycoside hydrolase/deacetylase ChbG (UPF0249 family)
MARQNGNIIEHKKSQRLIVTADDYGLCDSVNQGIEDCLAAGTVRATCIMANMPAQSAAACLRQKFPQTSIGIHWNLTQGCPVLPHDQVRSLINSDGSFFSVWEFKRRWSIGRIVAKHVIAELRAQFDRVFEAAGQVDFWNTHQDSHMYPGLFQAVTQLGRELGIPAMRCHRHITTPRGTNSVCYNVRHPRYCLKGLMIACWSCRAEAAGTAMPAGKISAPGYDGKEASIEEIIRQIPWRRIRKPIEMVIHPATTLRHDLFGTLTTSRLIQYHTFRNPKLTTLLRRNEIELVGFDALG